MAIGDDRGEEHRTALERLATGNSAQIGNNHVVPVLDKIEHEDLIFYVFPLMDIGFIRPWFYSFDEVIHACEQVLEGFLLFSSKFQTKLILNLGYRFLSRETCCPSSKPKDLHQFFYSVDEGQDLDDDNILINWVGGRLRPVGCGIDDDAPFRGLFPIRYYISDFEFAVAFDAESDPASRVVRGVPTARVGGSFSNYGRHVAPEMELCSL